MTNDERIARHELAKVEDRLAWLQREIDKQQGQRDALLCELQDTEGAASNRFVAAR